MTTSLYSNRNELAQLLNQPPMRCHGGLRPRMQLQQGQSRAGVSSKAATGWYESSHFDDGHMLEDMWPPRTDRPTCLRSSREWNSTTCAARLPRRSSFHSGCVEAMLAATELSIASQLSRKSGFSSARLTSLVTSPRKCGSMLSHALIICASFSWICSTKMSGKMFVCRLLLKHGQNSNDDHTCDDKTAVRICDRWQHMGLQYNCNAFRGLQ